MIAEECRTLRHQLEEVAQAESRQRIVGQLESRYEDLIELRETVLSATSALHALAARTPIVGTIDGTKAQSRLQSIREALRDDPQSITKGRNLSDMKRALKKFAETAEQVTQETWGQYVERACPKIDKNQFKDAELQDAFKMTTEKLQSLEASAKRMSKKPPASEDEFVNLEAVWQEIRDLIDELPAAANDPAVRDFLKAANSKEGADLDLLTDAVRQWLSENQTTDRYRIFGV